MNNKRAIVIVHSGNQEYFRIVLEQVKWSNPDERIIVIGDKSNASTKGVEHYYIEDNLGLYNSFVVHYKHMSTHSEWFELLCIKRWFCMHAIALNAGLDELWIHDSDNMIYSKYSNANPSENWDLAVCIPKQEHEYSWAYTGAISFFKTQTLKKFIQYMINLYQPSIDKRLTKKWQYHLDNNGKGGICDMTLLSLFCQDNPELKTINLLEINKNSTTDLTITKSDNAANDFYRMNKGLKYLEFKRGMPFGQLKDSATPILFHSLQFQGGSKKYIHRYVSYQISKGIYLKREIKLFFTLFAKRIISIFNIKPHFKR